MIRQSPFVAASANWDLSLLPGMLCPLWTIVFRRVTRPRSGTGEGKMMAWRALPPERVDLTMLLAVLAGALGIHQHDVSHEGRDPDAVPVAPPT
jgi:hypothetical protein